MIGGEVLNQNHFGLEQRSGDPPSQADQPCLAFKHPNQRSLAEFRQIGCAAMPDPDQRFRRSSDRRELRQNEPGMHKQLQMPAIGAAFIFINIILIIRR